MSDANYDPLIITTPLGDGKLRLVGLHGEEEISGLFHYTLELVSDDVGLDFTRIVGRAVTVSMTYESSDTPRYLNGIVSRFVQAGSDTRGTTYHAELRPWLWWLSLDSACRIFQNKSVPDIITAVFQQAGFSDYQNSLSGTYDSRDYCVQYRESSFRFLSRLMEDEGIWYFFKHENGKHTLILTDSAGPSTAGTPPTVDVNVQDATEYTLSEQVIVDQYRMNDYDFTAPSTPLLVTVGSDPNGLSFYEYPGGYLKNDPGQAKAKTRLQAAELPRRLLSGRGFNCAFTAGYAFTLKGHERSDANGQYVLRRVLHQASLDSYANTFEAFPSATPYRPPLATPKPVIPGAQTARVVDWTDEYGRVKVKFHWGGDQDSSCLIRVAQSWAGNQWGTVFLPRLNQEVVVHFLEGNPDQPIITGAVYNGSLKPPYALPGAKTQSTIKTISLDDQGNEVAGAFNEIRFEDKKDSEELYLHAQKDLKVDVLNDETWTIAQNRTTTIQQKDDTLVVDKGNRTIKVNTGNETHEVKGTRSLTVTGDETRTNKGKFTHEVDGDYALTVKGSLTIDVKGSVTIKAGSSLTNQAGTELTNKAGTSLTNQAGTELTNKAGTNLTNQAEVQLTNKASATQTVDGGGMLTVKGGMVKIN